MIRAVYFDVGSTILHPSPDVPGVFAEVALEYGYDFEVADIAQHMPAVYDYYEERYAEDASFWADDARSIEIWVQMYTLLGHLMGVENNKMEIARRVHDEFCRSARWSAYPDVEPTFKRLKALGLSIGLISNWGADLPAIIEGLPIAAYVDDVVASAEVRLHKPDHRIFELALERLGVAPHEAVHVGDHPVADVEGATGVGMMGVLLDRDGMFRRRDSIATLDVLEGTVIARGGVLPGMANDEAGETA